MKKQTPESNVLESIGEYLSYKGYFFWRQNNTPIFDGTKKVFRAMPRYSIYGLPDFAVFRDGQVWFIEAKAPKGKLSENQEKFALACAKHGIPFLLAKSIDDLTKAGF